MPSDGTFEAGSTRAYEISDWIPFSSTTTLLRLALDCVIQKQLLFLKVPLIGPETGLGSASRRVQGSWARMCPLSRSHRLTFINVLFLASRNRDMISPALIITLLHWWTTIWSGRGGGKRH